MQSFGESRFMRLKLFMTSNCNLRCEYCYEKHYREKKENDKCALLDLHNDDTISLLLEVVSRRMVVLGDNNLKVDFYGGEPMLEIDTIMKVSRKITERFPFFDKSFSITTNGTLINKENAILLQNFTVSISCDGDEKQNMLRVDKLGRPAFEKIIKGIEVLNEKCIDFKINMVVGSYNYRRVVESIKFLASLNCKYFSLAIDYSDAGWDNVSNEELEDFYDNLKQFALENYHNFKISLFEDSVIPLNQCYLTETIAVDVNGDVYPCIYFVTSDYNGKYCLGNIFDGYDGLRWNEINKFSKYLICDSESCRSKEGNCMLGCYGKNLQLTGNPYTISAIYCRHLRSSYSAIFKYKMKVLRKIQTL